MYGPILAQSSICHDFIRRIVAYLPILHPDRPDRAEFRIAGHYIFLETVNL